jgi:DNA ligase (NAD+)
MTSSKHAAGDGASRIAELAEAILRHKKLYYAGKPAISDEAFDKLEDELRALAPEHPVLSVVGGDMASDSEKVSHDLPMLSLQKTYEVAELYRWAGEQDSVGTVKVDGVSMSLVYEAGRLVIAKTRGNGYIGENVTSKVRWVPGIPTKVPAKGRIEIRGEVYCTEENFIRISETMVALGLDRPVSPRNIVAGQLGRKTHVDLARFFRFFGFSVVDYDNELGLKTEMEGFKWLEDCGFSLPFPRLVRGPQQIDAYLQEVRQLIEADEFPIDGAVFGYNSLSIHAELGNTAHHPRYKMSFKWQGETAESVIREIFWSPSRLGIITPVAVIEPVNLSGAQITNITLHNAAHVKTFNLKTGDRIEIVRSGEVIPKFLQVVQAAAGDYSWPQLCPACNTELEFDGVRLKCHNTAGCPAQQVGAVLNWIRCAEIDDLSEKRLVPLIEKGLVKSMADLYRLRLEDFYVIPQTKEKMATKLFNNIQKSRTLPLASFLNGLGIEGAGQTTWEKLLEVFPTLDALKRARIDDIAGIEGFADKTATQIVEGLAARADVIADLLGAGVEPSVPETAADGGDGPLAGKTLVITGALSLPRSDVEKAIKAAGGKTGSSVSKHTYAVITDDPDSGSSKMKKARDLGVQVWNEQKLWDLIERPQ